MNAKSSNQEKRAQFLKETIGISDNVNNTTENLLNILNTADTTVLDPIKSLIHPRRNISKIVSFYEIFWRNSNKLNEKREQLQKTKALEKDFLEIDELEKIKILEILKEMLECFNYLEKYIEIKIVKQLIDEEKAFFNRTLELISRSIIHSLERLPKIVENVDEYSRFVGKYSENNDFIKEYTKTCVQRLGFITAQDNCSAILQQTKNLSKHFNMIKSLNNKLIGIKQARAVNEGIVKLLVIDLKVIIGDILLKLEHKESPFDIQFLIKLYSRLRHSEDEIVEEIEELFVFKPAILKLIFNCFIQLFGLLSIIDKPRQDCKAEKLAIELSKILHLFEDQKDLLNLWTSQFGSSFGVYNEKDLATNFSEKCILRIFELAESLEIIEKSVYLINNIHLFKDFVTKISGLEVKKQIYKYCEIILGFVRIDTESRSPTETYENLVLIMKKMCKMSVPDEERLYLKSKLRKIVEQNMLREGIDGNLHVLFDLLEKCFTDQP